MAQGFMLQINNSTQYALSVSASTEGFSTDPGLPMNSWPAGTSSGLIYAEESGLATLTLAFSAVVGNTDFPQGVVNIRYDSSNTDEFLGLIYVAGATPAPINGSQNQIYPYLVLNQIFGNDVRWPFANLTFVEVVNPPLGYYPTVSTS
jgi:hypothetical protein